jgi:glycolate oxidase iron-sulfur subunit
VAVAKGVAPFPFPDPPAKAGYEACVHCGLCLTSCPTYQLSGAEDLSPRGRVFVVRAVAEGRLALDQAAFITPIDTCLDCRACETVCPSRVPVGALVERARGQLHRAGRRGRLRTWLMRRAVGRPERFPTFARLAYRLRPRPGRRFAGAGALVFGLLPAPMRELASSLPSAPGFTAGERLAPVTPARGPRRLRVALFTGCVQDVLFAPVHLATARALARNGVEVVLARGQGCCGALLRDVGDREGARALARRNVDALLATDADRIVTNAGGCGSALAEYGELLADDPAYASAARTLADRVVDVSRLLVEVGFAPPRTPMPIAVTYHESCHLANVLGTRAEPRALLTAIPGLRLLEMADPARCCGSAGIYNLEHPAVANRLLADKMATVPEGVEAIAAGNPGCALQLAMGARRTGRSLRIVHPVELLDEAYRRDDEAADA